MLLATVSALLASTTLFILWQMFGNKKWDPKGQHCYVTGGSAGLGLALAIHLVKRGADVSIVARNEGRLKKALEELEAARQTPNQILKSYAFSMSDLASSKAALDAACAPHGGRSPHAMFLCAGMSRPGFFIEETEGSMRDGMDGGYWVQAFSALAGSQRMVADRTRGKIIFVSSLLGYMSIVGYSTYAPAKHALRGLAETLRSELALYDIGVHIFFPATIYSPGYAEENKSKPKITLKIEEGDEGLKPEHSAATLLSGVENGNFHITSDVQAHLFRAATRGASPMNNVLLDGLYAFIGWIGIAIWRMTVDSKIIAHRAEHEEYLKRKGYFKVAK